MNSSLLRHLPAVLVLLAVLVLSAISTTALANDADVVRWTDENGVTQFTDRRFAPAHAQAVEMAPANGMDVPSNTGNLSSASGPVFTVLKLPGKQNPTGWRPRRERLNKGQSIRNN